MQKKLNVVTKLIKQSENILILSHVNPDADAYGSSLALYLGLRKLRKKVTIANESSAINKYSFLPEFKTIKKKLTKRNFDLVIFCDCGAKKRIGDKIVLQLPKAYRSINIDHHITNDNFADINLVLPKASSTSEIIFYLLSQLKVKLDRNIANCLLAGIMGDSGSFRYASVSPATFRVAATLTEVGGSPSSIATSMYSSVSLKEFQFENAAFNKINFYYGKQIAEIFIKKDLMKKYKCDAASTEGFVEKLREIHGVAVAVMVREDKDKLKISLRSKKSKHNVAKIAEMFGGGGHAQAAAFRYKNGIVSLRQELIASIKKVL